MSAPSLTLLLFLIHFSFLYFFYSLLMALVSHLQLWFIFFIFIFLFFFVYGFGFLIHLFFPFRLLFQTSLSWWIKKPSWRLTPTKWVVPQYFSCPLCIHHDGSLNHYDKETEQSWTLIGVNAAVSACDWIDVFWDRCFYLCWLVVLKLHTLSLIDLFSMSRSHCMSFYFYDSSRLHIISN